MTVTVPVVQLNLATRGHCFGDMEQVLLPLPVTVCPPVQAKPEAQQREGLGDDKREGDDPGFILRGAALPHVGAAWGPVMS
ncbi:hypothetical protein ACFVY1_44895 [Streptomyces sp. NPDC058293]|uniref:hypothetical protein n=1 Tax=Streptomyces sp. NPDC058293 TaxID=3346429 RepID=UPI0036E5B2D8